ncbi:hypothetical protein MWMV17_MWMV17_00658 [Acinetobacter calcoaceticus]|uniref:Uncharacterized protein n=1 Tax=Acinetobacter calcoaceticus DSM 30006 = CIP 81.8 TaxID=981331 RepID=A0ABN0K6P4_ACICA|nr:DUF6714 family protein [Acinetobacter calcoaceticus]ENV98982.1 hypothetical protein F936_02065 [Acinetobacter calcoaceticus DSM 30006 = CIP 81.8]CAI3111039.1 hypothetical protein MWMV17_MWMV17_00658 [Acinetobacter calcoaceticus]SUU55796.1 Uncharacterised protein [Acinetobacter calcoaceticus]
MNIENLKKRIELEFKNVTLGKAYTLPEEDYADTSYWYFDKNRTDLNLTEEEWIKHELHLLETGGWFREDFEEAVNAIKEKRKMYNRYSNPFEIPVSYLNNYHTGFGFLKPQGFLFYTPAIMNCVLKDTEVLSSNSFSSWLFRISTSDTFEEISKLLNFFTKAQIEVLKDFLLFILDISVEKKERINKSLNNIKLLEV